MANSSLTTTSSASRKPLVLGPWISRGLPHPPRAQHHLSGFPSRKARRTVAQDRPACPARTASRSHSSFPSMLQAAAEPLAYLRRDTETRPAAWYLTAACRTASVHGGVVSPSSSRLGQTTYHTHPPRPRRPYYIFLLAGSMCNGRELVAETVARIM